MAPAVNSTRFLQPEVLARLGNLELVARAVVDGAVNGLHRSPDFGFSQEFTEYRAYNEGDDLRYVDWNVYARSDRTYIKRFRGETNTRLMLLLDASASMGFGNPVSKLDTARFLLATLAWLARRQQDAVGLKVFDEAVRDRLPPSARPDTLARLLAHLAHVEARAGTRLDTVLQGLPMLEPRRGMVVVATDGYCDPDVLLKTLQPMARLGKDMVVFQVLDRAELEPDMADITALKDLETDDTVVVSPEYMRERYVQRLREHCEHLVDSCRRAGVDYIRVMTDEPLDAALHHYLVFRRRQNP